MALRWRIDGVLHCAAKHGHEDRDTYINDRLHYQLAVEMKVVRPYEDEEVSGLWHWTDGSEVQELVNEIRVLKGLLERSNDALLLYRECVKDKNSRDQGPAIFACDFVSKVNLENHLKKVKEYLKC